jgi:hypothetical protein
MPKHPIELAVFATILLLAGSFISCIDKDRDTPLTWRGNQANSVFVSNSDVYVAGFEIFDQYRPSIFHAVLWKNGVKHFRSDVPFTEFASVFVADSNVCVTGLISHPESSVLLRINDNALYYSDSYRFLYVTSIFVSGGDVYITGSASKYILENGSYTEETTQKAILWENGVARYLTDGNSNASANSVFVSGNDVYVAGDDGDRAVLWKNGAAQYLSDGGHPALAKSVFVSGDDIYVAGKDGDDAVLWKNGIAQHITTGIRNAVANSVFVAGDDVYVAGNQGVGDASLWKNNVWQNLTQNTFPAIYSSNSANSVFVSGGDVYVAGTEKQRATVWKNGVAQELR